MRAIATDFVAWSVCVSVCLLVMFVSRAKTAEPIEMPFVDEAHLCGPKERGQTSPFASGRGDMCLPSTFFDHFVSSKTLKHISAGTDEHRPAP